MTKRREMATARGYKREWDLVCQGRGWGNSSSTVTRDTAEERVIRV